MLAHRKLNFCRMLSRAGVVLIGLAFLAASAAGVEAQRLWTEQAAEQPALPALRQLNDALLDLTEQVLPAIISLQVRGERGAAPDLPRNHPPVPDPSMPITGSGFIIKANGLAITNQHVVQDKEEIHVRLFDGTQTRAKVLGRDTVGDIALLQIESETPLPVVPLGDSDALRVGEFVVAIGSPFGFENSVTFGMISRQAAQFPALQRGWRLPSNGRFDQHGQQRRAAPEHARRGGWREHCHHSARRHGFCHPDQCRQGHAATAP